MPSPTVVFLHAFPMDFRMWSGQLERLPAGWLGIAPDFPGFGGRAPGTASLDEYADEVLARLDGAGIRRFVPVGLSMGGYVAFRLVARASPRIAGLVLCDTRAAPDNVAARERRTLQAARIRADGAVGLADSMVPVLLAEGTRRSRPEVASLVHACVDAATPEGIARALEALRDRPDSTPLLAGLRMPVLAMVGEEDGLSPPAEMEGMVSAIPGARLEVLQGAGHLSNLDAPAAFDVALHAFLATLS
jgi:3-oxoadipate enol-lactonase